MRLGAPTAFVVWAGALLALGVACGPAARPAARPAAERAAAKSASPARAAPPRRRALDDLALLALGAPAKGTIAELEEAVLRGSATVAEYIDALVAEPSFARDTVPKIVLKMEESWDVRLPHVGRPLVVKDGVHFLPWLGGCSPKDAVKVRPWWAMDTEVLVCPSSYRPTRLKNATGWLYCSGDTLTPWNDPKNGKFCGCGPNLVNCLEAEELERVSASARDEVHATFEHVVGNDLPFDRVFTMNETVRDGVADALYAKWRMQSGHDATFSPELPIDAPPRLAPRRELVDGAHAGILTTQLVFVSDSPRGRMSDYFDYLWCTPRSSVDVDAEQIFAIGAANLREGEGWKDLAAKPVCTTCHARMDYAMQFFNGYLSHARGQLFLPAEHTPGVGPLFARNIDDKVGEAERTPRELAKLAVSHPAFASCMVQDVASHVFSGTATPEDGRVLREAFARRRSMKDVMRAALTRYEAAARASDTVADEHTPPGATESSRAALEEHCRSCHARGPKGFFALETWSPDLALRIAAHITHGTMPPDNRLDPETRRKLVSAVLAGSFPEPEDRRAALETLRMQLIAARREEAVQNVVHARIGTPPGNGDSRSWWPGMGLGYVPRYSGAVGAAVVHDALTECKAKALVGDGLRRCVEEATAIEGLVDELSTRR